MRVTVALVVDTFREAMARWIFIGLFALSSLMILFFLFLMRIDILEGATATISLFGQSSGRSQDVTRLVNNVYGGIATFLYTWGMGLAVFASAGLLPRVMEPGRIELILSKPVTRAHILLGRFLGNLLIVAANATYLVLGVWVIFGAKTGIWGPRFLIAIATSVFTFTVLLTVVVFLGVLVESTALSTMVTMGLMILSPVLAQTDTMMRLLSSDSSRTIWKALYYLLPKVYDIGRLTLNLVRGGEAMEWMPLWSSALFGAVVLAGAIGIFSRRDF